MLRKDLKKTGVFKKYNAFQDIENLPEGWVEEDTKKSNCRRSWIKI